MVFVINVRRRNGTCKRKPTANIRHRPLYWNFWGSSFEWKKIGIKSLIKASDVNQLRLGGQTFGKVLRLILLRIKIQVLVFSQFSLSLWASVSESHNSEFCSLSSLNSITFCCRITTTEWRHIRQRCIFWPFLQKCVPNTRSKRMLVHVLWDFHLRGFAEEISLPELFAGKDVFAKIIFSRI